MFLDPNVVKDEAVIVKGGSLFKLALALSSFAHLLNCVKVVNFRADRD